MKPYDSASPAALTQINSLRDIFSRRPSEPLPRRTKGAPQWRPFLLFR